MSEFEISYATSHRQERSLVLALRMMKSDAVRWKGILEGQDVCVCAIGGVVSLGLGLGCQKRW